MKEFLKSIIFVALAYLLWICAVDGAIVASNDGAGTAHARNGADPVTYYSSIKKSEGHNKALAGLIVEFTEKTISDDDYYAVLYVLDGEDAK